MTAALDERGLPRGYAFRPDLELMPRRVKALLDARDPKFVLLDCRTKGEWAVARIEGSTLIPLDELGARVGDIEAKADDESVIAVVCHHGSRSLRAALFLRQQGIQAMSVAGGIDLWSIDVDPSVPRY